MTTTSKMREDGVLVQTIELYGFDSVELWRAVFAHCSELEGHLRDFGHLHNPKGRESIEGRIERYKRILKDLNRLSNLVEADQYDVKPKT